MHWSISSLDFTYRSVYHPLIHSMVAFEIPTYVQLRVQFGNTVVLKLLFLILEKQLAHFQNSLFSKAPVYIYMPTQLGWASCLASAGRVTPEIVTTFLQINVLACLIGTALDVVKSTLWLDLEFKAEIRIKEVEINSEKPTAIEWPRETQRKRDICTFDYTIKIMNNHAEPTSHNQTLNVFK